MTYCTKLIQRFRLVVLFASLNRCIKSHEKLKKGGFAVEIVRIVGEFVLHEVEAEVGVLLHCLHQHINGLARCHFAFFKSDEVNVGAGDKGGEDVFAKFWVGFPAFDGISVDVFMFLYTLLGHSIYGIGE